MSSKTDFLWVGVDLSRTIAVVFAGGVGTRMGKAVPKQLLEVGNKPILVHTLDQFQAHDTIDDVFLVVAEDQVESMKTVTAKFGIDKVRKIVAGGSSAHESIMNGLEAAVNDGVSSDSVVLIHDGVRPILPYDLITKNIKSVLEFGSAITSIPAFETVGISRDGVSIEGIPERSEMYVLQAPQSFRLGKIFSANQRAREDGKVGDFIDQAHLMNYYNEKLHLVDGMRGNIKLTTPNDLEYFSYLFSSGEYQNLLGGQA
ncbi:MAG: IspD/TarI family cytidylyltransferase [Microbacteriaceae bacterium]